MADVDPALLAVSDVLILHALERAWARTVRRADRSCPAHLRHNQYLRAPVPEERIEAVLHDAWTNCNLLVHRHALPVDPVAWSDTLDSYTRALLLMCQPHAPARLTQVLIPLITGDVWVEDAAAR